MGMMINRRRACGGKKLPYDAEIEYLESSGTQYIDTGVKTSTDMEGEIRGKFLYIDNTTARLLASQSGSIYNSLICWNFNSKYFVQFSGNGSFYTSIRLEKDTNIHTLHGVVTPTTVTMYVDSNMSSAVGNIAGNNINLYINARNIDGTATEISTYRYYYVKIWKSGALVRDFIPVRVGQVGYMYDKVSGQLFGNDGTGSFILGPDKGSVNVNVNVKTHSTGGSDASLDVTTGDREPVNIVYSTVIGASWDDGYILINYNQSSYSWQLFATTPCLYDGQVYNSGDLIASWRYTETKDISLVANI